MFINNTIQEYMGDCLYIDSILPLIIKNSIFINNSIIINGVLMSGGNPCINVVNFVSIIYIDMSFFKYNKAYDQSNCLKFIGSILQIQNSIFEGMEQSSDIADLGNCGALNLAGNNIVLFNISFLKNRAFKAASILIKNVIGESQIIQCEKVYKIYVYFYLFLIYCDLFLIF